MGSGTLTLARDFLRFAIVTNRFIYTCDETNNSPYRESMRRIHDALGIVDFLDDGHNIGRLRLPSYLYKKAI